MHRIGLALFLGLAGCAHMGDEARVYCDQLTVGRPVPPTLSAARTVHVGSEVIVFNKERKGCSCRFTLRDKEVTDKRLICG
jgi:hypothetical protein